MMLRLVTLAAALPLASFCQIQLFLFDGSNETAIGSGLSVGAAAVGQTLETIIRIRNVGSTSVTVANISLSGQYFSIVPSSVPSMPYILASGKFISFEVDFSPQTVAMSDSANLQVNTLTVVLRASATAASQLASVYLDGAATALAAGATIDFGSVLAGSSSSHAIRVDNTGGVAPVTLGTTGTGFQASAAPAQVGAGAAASFSITFSPTSGQAFSGTLSVGQSKFTLQGQGVVAQTPSASITVNNGMAVTSSQQVTVSIPLASPAQSIASGTLTLQFQPSAGGATNDPAILFLSGAARSATVSVLPGDTTVRINGNPSIALQTGTTAGSILLNLQLGSSGSQVSIPIAPAPINIETAGGVVSTNELTISLTGFDNTHTASQLDFTFYDVNNNKVTPGTITVQASTMFQALFNQGAYGGMFSLNASFPVSGNVTLISTGQVGLTNSAGVTQTQRIVF